MELRDYQQRAVDELRQAYCDGHEGAILELGTGAGKTVTACSVVAGALRLGAWVLWVAHRRELLQQARNTLGAVGLGWACDSDHLVLRTVQSQMPERPDAPAVIVVDEGHRAMAASYRKVFERWPQAFRVLLTGTAWRSDGARFDAVATAMVKGPTVGELTEAGWLVPAVYWSVPGADLSSVRTARGDFRPGDLAQAFDRPQLVGDVAATLQRWASDRRAVVFASGVQHAQHVAEALRARGVAAAVVSASTPKQERARLLERHEVGDLQVLCCADLLIEGWDNPAVSAVVVARATQSVIVWRQAVGRGLRLHGGKNDCVVLDHGGNWARLGPVDEPLEYEPGSGQPRGKPRDGLALMTCQACFAVLPSQTRPLTCPRCYAMLPRGSKAAPEVKAGELQQMEGRPDRQARTAVDWHLWRQIDKEREQRGYKPGWTWAQYALRVEAKQWNRA